MSPEMILPGGGGARGGPPASVTIISGDIHHSYLTAVDPPGGHSAVNQAVCSPIHNAMPPLFRRGQRLLVSRAGGLIAPTVARRARGRNPPIRRPPPPGPGSPTTPAPPPFTQ